MSLLIERHLMTSRVARYGQIIPYASVSTVGDSAANAAAIQTITPPAGMKVGDLVVTVFSARHGSDYPIAHSNTGGQAWTTLIDYQQVSGNGIAIKIEWCIFNGTWSANPSWTFAGGAVTKPRSGQMHVFRSTSPYFSTWQFEGYNGGGADGTNPIVVLGRVVTKPSTLSIAIAYIVNGSTWTTPAETGWVNVGLAQYRNIIELNQSLTYAYKTMFYPNVNTGNMSKNSSINPNTSVQFLYTFNQVIR